MSETTEPTENTVDTSPKSGDTPNGALGDKVENKPAQEESQAQTACEKPENEEDCCFDFTKPELRQQADKTYTLYKNGESSRCPEISPEKYLQRNATTGNEERFLIFQPCNTSCAKCHIVNNPDAEGVILVHTCAKDTEMNKYFIPKDRIIPYVPKQEPKKETPIGGILKNLKS